MICGFCGGVELGRELRWGYDVGEAVKIQGTWFITRRARDIGSMVQCSKIMLDAAQIQYTISHEIRSWLVKASSTSRVLHLLDHGWRYFIQTCPGHVLPISLGSTRWSGGTNQQGI